MEHLGEYLRKNITIAAKSVLYNYKQYAVFFIAIFLVQTLLGIITAAADNDNVLEYKYVSEEYDYHFVLTDLNEQQRLTLVNDTQTVFGDEYIFDIVREVPRDEEGTYDRRYDLFIKLHEKIESNYRIFQYRYFDEMASMSKEGLHLSESPLMHFDRNLAANRIYYLLFLLILTIISIFFLMSLYYVRLNHYSFTYGIYMSFGADFRKLFGTAFWEMLVISLTTYLPSCLISAVIDLVIYHSGGEPFTWRFSGALKVLAFSLIITALSVIWPVWRFSRREPMKNLIAEDNSNLVISPRTSFDLSKAIFTRGYELRSLWRFRKYQIRQIITSVIFISLFMSVLYYADVCRLRLEYETPQFSLDFSASDISYTEDERKDLLDIEGIAGLKKDISVTADSLRSHVIFDQSNIRPFTKTAFPDNDTKANATNIISYHACDSEVLEDLKQYKYKGDPDKILTDSSSIIISDSYDNIQRFNIKPGDKIKIAKFSRQHMMVNGYLSGIELLSEQLKCYDFDYTEYTVCAVLKDIPCFGTAPVYLNTEEFQALTDTEIEFNSVDIYIEEDADINTVNRIKEEIRQYFEIYSGVELNDTHAASDQRIEKAKQKPAIYTVCASAVLLFAPLIQIFTQTLYYRKRENEFSILETFGAISSEIRSIFREDGIFSTVSGIVLSQAINFAAVYFVFWYANVVAPKFGGMDVRYPFLIHITAVAVGIITAAASGLISSYMPYRTYVKNKTRTEEPEEFKTETEQ